MYENSKALVRFGLAYVAEGVLEMMEDDELCPFQFFLAWQDYEDTSRETCFKYISLFFLLTITSQTIKVKN